MHCGGICPRILIQWCAHKWASNLAPYIDSQIRQFRKQRLRGEAWVTCEVKYKRVKQKKARRMMMEEDMIFSSVFPKRSEFCNTLSYHGIRNFLHAVTKRKFLRLNQCLRKNCADHPYKSEGKSSAKWQMTPPLLVICQEMLVSSWLLLSSFLLKWKGWCIIFSFTLAMSTIFNAEWRCNLTVIKRIKLQLWRSRSCFRFALAKHYYFSKIINC